MKECKKCKESIQDNADKCPKCQSDLRNWFVRHPILTVLICLFAFGIIVNPSKNKPLILQPSPRVISNTQTNLRELEHKPKEYKEIFSFSGSGAKTSEPFIIQGSRFKIKYDCKGDLCGAFLKKPSIEWDMKLIMNETSSTSDETIFYGSGEYYIDANTAATFEMTVEDYL